MTHHTETGRHTFALRGLAPCAQCQGVAVAVIDVGPTGWSAGSGFIHTDACPTTMCPHGFKWERWQDCEACEAEDAKERCEGCREAVNEDEIRHDEDGLAFCPDCWADATADEVSR